MTQIHKSVAKCYDNHGGQRRAEGKLCAFLLWLQLSGYVWRQQCIYCANAKRAV